MEEARFALAVAVAGSFPVTAFAQDANSGGGDIIVTARRIEERLQDVPISITAYNQQQLTDRNVTNASDLATYTPSLAAEGRFGANASSFAIRGFAQDIGTAPSVGVYFADVVAPRARHRARQPATERDRACSSTCRTCRC